MQSRDKSTGIGEDRYTLSSLLDRTSALALADFEKPSEQAAEWLLGCVLIHGETAGTIVETEAYLGLDDLAAHASRGRTPRTEVLFGPAGHAYVYFIYGMHECLNVVADRDGSPGCVLVRALEPLCGLSLMRRRRRWEGKSKGLTNGPGKLTEALAITRSLYGSRLDRGPLSVRRWLQPLVIPVARTPRIGITKCMDWPLRFVWAGHPCLSRSV